jgi:hypothetical protein
LIADASGEGEPAGFPIDAWADAIAASAARGFPIALIAAPGYIEDNEIIAYVARQLHACGFQTQLAKPEQIAWSDGVARLSTGWYSGEIGALVRFYQSEWLARLPRGCGWRHFFLDGRTPVGNPGIAVLGESKRLPLVWDRIDLPISSWRAVLPETRDPREAPWETDGAWIIKSAYCNNGDTVGSCGWLSPGRWQQLVKEVRRKPAEWVAQRRFDTLACETPAGPMRPCLGVYVINGVAAGIYGRLSSGPIIDYAAMDAAVLVASDDKKECKTAMREA